MCVIYFWLLSLSFKKAFWFGMWASGAGKPGVLQSMGLQRVRHDSAMNNNNQWRRLPLKVKEIRLGQWH